MKQHNFWLLVIPPVIVLACNQLTLPFPPPENVKISASPSIERSLTVPESTVTPEMTLSVHSEKLYLTFKNTANCRYGPSQNYAILTIMNTGEIVEVLGRNEDDTWFLIYSNRLNLTCWVSTVTGKLSANASKVTIVTSAPTPALFPTKLQLPNQLTSTSPPFLETATLINP